MRSFWRGLGRIFFWSYDRGSWPYDILVVVIVLFVLLTPRSWFRDQPVFVSPALPGIQLISQDDDSGNISFRLDASLLPPEKRTAKPSPELERETHDILSRNVVSLKGQTFQVVSIDPVTAENGSVISYDVTIHP
ncbi:MAG TPA: hypothetical protein VL913_01235 [Candidatus Micrarchaeaceae archaeon]|nr:hypothetical protein [Candidatus Micrarchaeaceae archaeon]